MVTEREKFVAADQKTWFRFFLVGLMALLSSACTTFEYHETKIVRIEKVSSEQEQLIDEEQLLDVGIVLFDPGQVDLDSDETYYSSVRQSESVWFSTQLKRTLEKSNAWGLVRALPRKNLPIDLLITGELIESNGEFLKLHVVATDSTGLIWVDKRYDQQASAYAYNPEVDLPDDPFQATFNEIANDLFNYQASLGGQQLLNIRSISKVLFARDFVPDAFNDYISQNENGEMSLSRIPASNDPMMQRVDRIRSRNDLFVDVVQDYYRAFNQTMEAPYQEWRKLSYKEVVYARQLKEQARKEKIAGLAVMAGGLVAATQGDSRVTRGSGHVGIISGSQLFARSFLKTDEALAHSSKLREMGASLELELEPSIVQLQDRSVTLSGTVEDQFVEWRRILGKMFELEEGEVTRTEQPANSDLLGDSATK